MIHLGIDPSTKVVSCVALAGDQTPVVRSYALRGERMTTRMSEAFKCVERILNAVDSQLNMRPETTEYTVAIEAPPYVNNHQTVVKLAQVSGALVAGFLHCGIEPYLVPVSRWKKEVVGSGNASKQEVAEWVEREWPELHRRALGDQDAIDAACIARYAVLVHHRASALEAVDQGG